MKNLRELAAVTDRILKQDCLAEQQAQSDLLQEGSVYKNHFKHYKQFTDQVKQVAPAFDTSKGQLVGNVLYHLAKAGNGRINYAYDPKTKTHTTHIIMKDANGGSPSVIEKGDTAADSVNQAVKRFRANHKTEAQHYQEKVKAAQTELDNHMKHAL